MPEKGFLLFEAVKWEEFILKETALFIIAR